MTEPIGDEDTQKKRLRIIANLIPRLYMWGSENVSDTSDFWDVYGDLRDVVDANDATIGVNYKEPT